MALDVRIGRAVATIFVTRCFLAGVFCRGVLNHQIQKLRQPDQSCRSFAIPFGICVAHFETRKTAEGWAKALAKIVNDGITVPVAPVTP